MYTKEELESMDIPQLVGIADQLGIKVSPDDQLETVVYAILDKAAENSATADDAPKRKRTRIAKKDTSRVYTVNGEDGENLDTKSNRTRKKAETPSLFTDMPAETPAAEPAAPVAEEEKPKSAVARLRLKKKLRKQLLVQQQRQQQPNPLQMRIIMLTLKILLCPRLQSLPLEQATKKKPLLMQ